MKVLFKIHIISLVTTTLVLLNSCATNNENLCDEGKTLYQQGSYKEAVEKFDAYLAANPDFSKGAFNWNPNFERTLTAKGNAHFQLNQFDKAVESYNRSIEVGGAHANNEINYFNRGLAQFYLNEKKYALESFDKVVDIRFTKASMLLLKADIFTESEKPDTAMFLIDKCLELDKKNGNALIRKVRLWLEKDEMDTAELLFERILGMKNSRSFSLFTRDLTIMDSYYAPAPAEHDSAAFYQSQANDHIEAQDFSGAAEALTKALEFSSAPTAVLLKLGDVNMALGNIDVAIGFFDNALEHNLFAIDAAWKKANALLTKGEKDAAGKLYENVLSQDPENIYAFVALKLYFDE